MVKIGAELGYRNYPKNKTVYPFFGPPCNAGAVGGGITIVYI